MHQPMAEKGQQSKATFVFLSQDYNPTAWLVLGIKHMENAWNKNKYAYYAWRNKDQAYTVTANGKVETDSQKSKLLGIMGTT